VIAEALEAAWLVASALAAWIVAGVVAVTVGLYGVVVAGWGIWRMLRSAWGAMAPRTDSLPPLAAEQPAEDRIPLEPSGGRPGPPLRPAPTWARKDAA
jgi:hypothetical protein